MKTAWLLEAPGPKYLCLTADGGFCWGSDANAARQYQSEDEAREAHAIWCDHNLSPMPGLFDEVGGGDNVLPREHGWPSVSIYPNRDIMHRQMGPLDSCDLCFGRGWCPDEESPREKYCDCACGKERRRVDGADES